VACIWRTRGREATITRTAWGRAAGGGAAWHVYRASRYSFKLTLTS
jgi:hypothetical protein